MISRLTDSVLESLAGLEGWNLHSWDLDLLRWVAWVDTRASLALGDAECAETSDGYVVTLLELLRNCGDESLERIGSSTLCDARSISHCGDEILLGHKTEGGINKYEPHSTEAKGYCKPKIT